MNTNPNVVSPRKAQSTPRGAAATKRRALSTDYTVFHRFKREIQKEHGRLACVLIGGTKNSSKVPGSDHFNGHLCAREVKHCSSVRRESLARKSRQEICKLTHSIADEEGKERPLMVQIRTDRRVRTRRSALRTESPPQDSPGQSEAPPWVAEYSQCSSAESAEPCGIPQ